MTTTELEIVHSAAWEHLHRAVTDGDCALHYLTLSTIAAGASDEGSHTQEIHPRARLLVLRAADSKNYHLEFHTDIRSPKWQELKNNSSACVTGYDPTQRFQLRLQGNVTLLDPQTPVNATTWSALSAWTKTTYCADAPGTPVKTALVKTTTAITTTEQTTQLAEVDTEKGHERFGVLLFKARSLDWCQLERGNNRRAFFQYTKEQKYSTGDWISP